MSADENLQRMKTLDDAWNAQNWEVFRKRHSADTKVYWPGQPEPTRGRDAHQAESEAFFKSIENHLENNPYRVMFTTQDFLKQHPDAVAKFVDASLRGWRDYLDDPSAAHAAISKLNPALNAQWMEFTWKALRDGHFVTGDDPSGAQLGKMNAERWSTMYAQLLDLKVIEKQFDPATAYTLQFVGTK